MLPEDFEKLVADGIEAIPARFLAKLKNVAIVIEEEPTAEQRKKLKLRKDMLLFGLYEGVPQTVRPRYELVLPDKITIFRKPIESAAASAQDIITLVRDTVWHEIAHYFGMDESQVRNAERRKMKRGCVAQ